MPPTTGLAAAAVDLQILTPPAVNRLYFWALQATFSDRIRDYGGAHLGLQWNPAFPNNRAVNWGGYDQAGRVLEGTESPLPSTPNDPNTRDYPWKPGRSYRLQIRAGEVGWCGEITDLENGETVIVRELAAGGDRLSALVVWSEIFADCDHPRVVASWSAFEAFDREGRTLVPGGMRVNYQAFSQGGCSNTTVVRQLDEVLQITNAERTLIQGSVIPWGSPG
jgi:hypothetical protein